MKHEEYKPTARQISPASFTLEGIFVPASRRILSPGFNSVLEICPHCPSRQTVTSVSTRDARLMKILENGFTKALRRIDFISAKSCTPHMLQHKLIVCLLFFEHTGGHNHPEDLMPKYIFQ